MGIYLNPGNESFQRALRSRIYVDKTELISYTNSVLGTEQANICVSRPRRFGKSMAANMLAAYYSRGCKSCEIFENLAIYKDRSFKQHLNRYDVIFINVQQFMRGAGKPENLIRYMESEIVSEIKVEYNNVIDGQETRLPDILTKIFVKDTRQNKGFIFILDEWDCIFREEKNNIQVQKEYLNFLQDLFKDRAYVQMAYMTGILPIKKYPILLQ